MFVKLIKEDITTVKRGIIPHGVNCQGRMASGVAKAIKEKWPKVYDRFMKAEIGKEMLGKVDLVYIENDLVLVNCYTQEFYGRDGKRYASLEAVQEALSSVFTIAAFRQLPVCMPKIGCGLGGLSWKKEVLPIVAELAANYDVSVYVYEI